MSPPPLTQRLGASLWWLEDDRELCWLLQNRLRACGWRLSLYHRVPDLRAALLREEPDLLLLDRRIPGGDGLELLEQLRGENHHFPVLILSGLVSADHRVEGLAAGANDYLIKPFCFPELMWRIERLLQFTPPRPIQATQRLLIPIGPLTLDPAEGWLRWGDGVPSPTATATVKLDADAVGGDAAVDLDPGGGLRGDVGVAPGVDADVGGVDVGGGLGDDSERFGAGSGADSARQPDAGAVAGGARGDVRLSRGDRALLLALLQAPGVGLSRLQLARASGSLVDVATSRSLDVRLSRLRRLLRRLSAGAVSIEAVRGLGYRLCLPPPAPGCRPDSAAEALISPAAAYNSNRSPGPAPAAGAAAKPLPEARLRSAGGAAAADRPAPASP